MSVGETLCRYLLSLLDDTQVFGDYTWAFVTSRLGHFQAVGKQAKLPVSSADDYSQS